MRHSILATIAAVLALPALGRAQEQPASHDPIEASLFPPEMVMYHQADIGLDAEQATSIKEDVHKAQAAFVDLQWQLESEKAKLAKLLQARPVDEVKALAQLDVLVGLETQIKKSQLSLLIRIKNLLREEQVAKLSELRRNAPQGHH